MTQKEWLVRTRNGEVLGPFTARELLEELGKKQFTLEDEIAPSKGRWISAQSLTSHELDEVTHTSTRNQSLSSSTASTAGGSSPQLAIELEPESEMTLTPTPPVDPNPRANLEIVSEPANSEHRSSSLAAGMTLLLVVLGVAFMFWNRPPSNPESQPTPKTPLTMEGDSTFVREIYQMIQRGETAPALQRLTQYHEKRPAPSDIEYLVPYSALLITEGESSGRAKKFLEQVLKEAKTPYLKSRSHHWLGYLALSESEGDMGESHFLEALQLNPKDAAARFNLGRAYLKQEKFSQALDYLQLAELEMPDLWLIHIYKGRTKVALGNMDDAHSSFKSAIQNGEDRWLVYIYYALYLLGINQFDEAHETMRKMLTRDPHFEVHYPAPLGFYQERVNYTEYLDAFTQIMQKGTPEVREIGKLYISYLQNRGPEGKRLENMGVKGGLLSKVIALKILLDRNAKPEELKSALVRLPINLSEFGYYAYHLRAEASLRLGAIAEAQQDLTQAISLSPSAAAPRLALYHLHWKSGRRLEAKNQLDLLLKIHPLYLPAIQASLQNAE